jgi:ribosomal protein L30
MAEKKTVTIRLVRSTIHAPKKVRAVAHVGLQWRKIDQTTVRPDDAATRGMIDKVRQLVEVTR